MVKQEPTFNLKKLKRAEFMVVASIGMFVAMLAVASTFAGFDDVLNEFKKLNTGTVLLLLLVTFINYSIRGLRWPIFGKRLGLKIPFGRMMVYYYAGMSMITTPGKVGTALRLWFMKRCHNVNYRSSVPLMIMDPLTDVFALFSLSLMGIGMFHGKEVSLAIFGFILLTVVTFFARPVLFVKTLKLIYCMVGKRKPRLFASLLKVVRSMTALVNPKMLVGTVGFSMIAWVITCYAFWDLLMIFGADITLIQAIFIFAFSTILGGAAMTPGGLGGTEASMFTLLVALGTAPEVAIAAVSVIRMSTLWFSVLSGFVVLPFALRLANKK